MPALYLCAADPAWVPDGDRRLLSLLAELGLVEISAGVPGVEGALRAGPEFLALLTFLGCSPHVVLEPGGGKTPCHLRQHLYPEVRFIASAASAQVRCPHCRHPIDALGSGAHDALHTCAGCGRITALSALDWRRSAGFGRCFLEIVGVHPHEAVPSDRLLDSLRELSSTDWQYFYTN